MQQHMRTAHADMLVRNLSCGCFIAHKLVSNTWPLQSMCAASQQAGLSGSQIWHLLGLQLGKHPSPTPVSVLHLHCIG